MTSDLSAQARRFSGFADLYDAVRSEPPAALAEVLTRYCGGRPAVAVDLGSGTGLSTRWLARWADAVVGVEPSADMRAVAESQAPPTVRFVAGWSHDTGLPDASVDVVVAVQALHWMEPQPTLAEVARLLRPGGVLAAIDCDWPPTLGDATAERAWATCRRAIRVLEERLADGLEGDALRAPIASGDGSLVGWSGRDAHRARRLAVGVRSWSKDRHLDEMVASGRFRWCHEVALHHVEDGDAARYVGLMRSQGDYQTLRRHGLDDDVLGLTAFESAARHALGDRTVPFLFTYRARIGVA